MSKDEMYVHISYIEDSIKFVRSAVDRDDETAMKAVVLINNEISRKLIKARGGGNSEVENT